MKIALGLICLFFTTLLGAQQTVGLFKNDSNAYPGYTLISPTTGNDTYLIDNCGEVINKWELNSKPGFMTYLMEDGTLLRSERIDTNFNGGGAGGRISKYDWDGNLIWQFDLNSTTFTQHHDLAILPNGNFLSLSWELFTREEIIAAGRNPNIVEETIWLEKIVELKPQGINEAEEVWSWHLIDHLIQDHDAAMDNFGVVKDHPEKMNINFIGLNSEEDWIHFNSIDYNETLDQIVVSSRHLSEFWILDHSTTTEEAATSSGGDTDKGGSILYRWGNPAAYNRGSEVNKVSFGQHDATWMKYGDEQAWAISIYNNGTGRPPPSPFFSQIDFIKLPINSNNTYDQEPGQPYAPSIANYSLTEIEDSIFFHNNMSGVQVLPNGHMLICVGAGKYYEVDTINQELVWQYFLPLKQGNPIIQGDPQANAFTFKVRRYPLDFPGLAGKDLTPKGRLELNPLPPLENCESVSTDDHSSEIYDWSIAPNPANDQLFIETNAVGNYPFKIYNAQGQLIYINEINQRKTIDLNQFSKGVYFLNTAQHGTKKFIIQRP